VEAPGWGRGNVFAGNVAHLGADDRVSGAGKGLSNIPCR
jgi:hypothetical protein